MLATRTATPFVPVRYLDQGRWRSYKRGMTNTNRKPSLLDLIIARRDMLHAQHAELLAAGNRFAAADMADALRFACAAANDALMGRC